MQGAVADKKKTLRVRFEVVHAFGVSITWNPDQVRLTRPKVFGECSLLTYSWQKEPDRGNSCSLMTARQLPQREDWRRRDVPRQHMKRTHLVDAWVVNDFVRDVQLAVWIALAGLVCHLHSPLNTPTKAISFRKVDCHISELKLVSISPHLQLTGCSKGLHDVIVTALVCADGGIGCVKSSDMSGRMPFGHSVKYGLSGQEVS
jgi:hypothetical protein